MRFPLRIKLLIITVVPLLGLVGASVWLLNRSMTQKTNVTIQDDLRRSSAVFENMLDARARSLAVSGEVIVRDPRFFSVLTLPGGWRDAQVRATVTGVAKDFNAITTSDLFEVFDASKHRLASVGRDPGTDSNADPLSQAALSGHPASGVLVIGTRHYQAGATPVIAGGRVVGALLLGARISGQLARDLRSMTRSEVTFVSGESVTASTLGQPLDRTALLHALDSTATAERSALHEGTVLRIASGPHTWLTLVRQIPGSAPDQRQLYAMQRALDVETAALVATRQWLIGFGVIAAFAALVACMYIAHRITAPVRRMVHAAEEIELGNYDVPLRIRSHDEIGDLATRFDGMRQQQRDYVASLQEAARIKSEFISVASHELRTPISVIKGFQELMADGVLGPISEKQARALEAIGSGLGTLESIAHRATRMAQIEGERLVLSPADHDITEILDHAIETATGWGPGRRVRVTRMVEAGLRPMHVDSARLGDAIANLVSNAIRFTPDGGSIFVRARDLGDRVEIEVEDTGIGISEEQQRRLFERNVMVRDARHHHSSQTLEYNSAGLGLGLSIAGGIVRAHGGSLNVVSQVGHGSTFTIVLPVTSPLQLEAA
jgi:signal transduction histidine kinase